MSRRVTIKDVAARAGITDMTVSRVVNRSGPVSDTVRKRVEEAIEELGYVPNRLARGLRSNRTHTIALVVTDVTNPFFTTVARGVEDAASDKDNLVLLCNTDESEQEELRYIEMLAQQSVDGILLVPARTGEAARELARRRNVPIVILDRRIPDPKVNVVRCDSQTGAAEMATLLLGLGHRHFAILAGPQGVPTSDDRIAGFRQSLTSDTTLNVIHGKYSLESGREMAEQLRKDFPNVTAVFALNNFITIGAMQRLDELGCRVPEDCALVGFDDLPRAFVSQPFLTVVAQPAYEMGRRAVHLLLESLASSDPQPTEIVLATEIIIRKSSGSAIVS